MRVDLRLIRGGENEVGGGEMDGVVFLRQVLHALGEFGGQRRRDDGHLRGPRCDHARRFARGDGAAADDDHGAIAQIQQ